MDTTKITQHDSMYMYIEDALRSSGDGILSEASAQLSFVDGSEALLIVCTEDPSTIG
jgi:hypothetical protein